MDNDTHLNYSIMETKFSQKAQFHLADALNYEKGKVMFETIMSSHNGSVDIVALDRESHLESHPAPEDVLVYILEGKADFHIGEDVERLSQGDSMLLAKGTLHSVKPLRDTKVMLVKIRP